MGRVAEFDPFAPKDVERVPVKAGDGDCYWVTNGHLYSVYTDDRPTARQPADPVFPTLCGRVAGKKRVGILANVTCDECRHLLAVVLLITSEVP